MDNGNDIGNLKSFLREKVDGTCKKCGKERLRFYDGCLGYESIVCELCGYDQLDEE